MKTVSSGPEFCPGSVVITNSAIFALEKKVIIGIHKLNPRNERKITFFFFSWCIEKDKDFITGDKVTAFWTISRKNRIQQVFPTFWQNPWFRYKIQDKPLISNLFYQAYQMKLCTYMPLDPIYNQILMRKQWDLHLQRVTGSEKTILKT